jgi:hypothetical protein
VTVIENAGRPLAFNADGSRLFVGGKRAELLDVDIGQPVVQFPETLVYAAAFSPDGHRLAIPNDYDNVVRVYDATPRAGFPDPRRRDDGPGLARWWGTLVTAALILAGGLLIGIGLLALARRTRRATPRPGVEPSRPESRPPP